MVHLEALQGILTAVTPTDISAITHLVLVIRLIFSLDGIQNNTTWLHSVLLS